MVSAKSCAASWSAITIIAFVYAVFFAASYRSWHDLPTPLGDDASRTDFAESRAMAHVKALSDDIGVRLAGSPNLDRAEKYLSSQLRTLARLATPDKYTVEFADQTTAGQFFYDLFRTPLYLSYGGLKNVMLKISPVGANDADPQKALLLNAHFDSAIGSPGAADCASCVAVIIEAVRAILEREDVTLASPIIILLNGGEEIYMNAVHGFITQHPWAADIGAFINLESTGSYGPDVAFRSNSELLMQSYIKSIKYPRANVVFQDIFNTGIIPSDTDFSILQHPDFGNLPGLDLATTLDSRSYHTARDTSDRIAPGCLQNYGDNMVGLILNAAEMLAAAGAEGGALSPEEDERTTIYFDILSQFMVSYPAKVAEVMHIAPIVLTCALFFAFSWRMHAHTGTFPAIFSGLVVFATSFVMGLVFPIALGLAIVLETNSTKAMIWYGRPHIAAMLLAPASLIGMLLPYYLRSRKGPRSFEVFSGQIFASCLLLSLLSAAMTTSGIMKSSGYIFSLWVLSSLATLLLPFVTSTFKGAKRYTYDALILHLPAMLVLTNISLFAFLFLGERASTMGSNPGHWTGIAHADMVFGGVVGLTLFISVGPLIPWIFDACPPGVLGLCVLSMLASGVLVRGEQAFSAHNPKRVFVQHLHVLGAAGSRNAHALAVRESSFVMLGVDSVPLLPTIRNLTGSYDVVHMPNQKFLTQAYPLTKRMKDSIMFKLDSSQSDLILPKVRVTTTTKGKGQAPTDVKRDGKGGLEMKGEGKGEGKGGGEGGGEGKGTDARTLPTRRCEVVIDVPFAASHVLNITAHDLVSWSFSSEAIPSERFEDGSAMYVVKHTGDRRWRWWFEVGADAPQQEVIWTYSHSNPSESFAAFLQSLPEHLVPIALTTFWHSFVC